MALHPDEARFWMKVDMGDNPSRCWEWLARKFTQTGYGAFLFEGKTTTAHRASWLMAGRGEIADGWDVDHICSNRGCVNPGHLQVMTHAEHGRKSGQERGIRARMRSHCRNGHAWSEHGRITPGGKRLCRICRRETLKRYNDKQRRKNDEDKRP